MGMIPNMNDVGRMGESVVSRVKICLKKRMPGPCETLPQTNLGRKDGFLIVPPKVWYHAG